MTRAFGLFGIGTLSLLVVAGGCGDDGPPRYQLSGRVSYEGKPIPAGWIVFAPEEGPGATANISNGRYETPEGWGTIGGSHTIEVVALDGVAVADSTTEGRMNAAGSPMFSCTLRKDIPKEATTWDIEIRQADLQQ